MTMMERLNRALNNPLVALAAAVALLGAGVALGHAHGRVAGRGDMVIALERIADKDTDDYRVVYRCAADHLRSQRAGR